MNRRQIIAALSLTPWVKPVVNSVVLPAHAVTSEPVLGETPAPEPAPVEPEPVPEGLCQITVNNPPDKLLIEVREGTRIVYDSTEPEFIADNLQPREVEIWVYDLNKQTNPNQDFEIFRQTVTESDCRIVIEHVRFLI